MIGKNKGRNYKAFRTGRIGKKKKHFMFYSNMKTLSFV